MGHLLSAPPPLPVDRIGMIARWKPVHRVHSAVLRALCDAGRHAVIGIGSSNRYDRDNPFTAEETAAMVRLALRGRDNYTLVEVPDLGDGPRWAGQAVGLLAPLDLFVTDNRWTAELLVPTFDVLRPIQLLRPEDRAPIDGFGVRLAMARGEDWRALVEPEIASFLDSRGLVARFRSAFGAETEAVAARRPPGH